VCVKPFNKAVVSINKGFILIKLKIEVIEEGRGVIFLIKKH